MSSEKSFYEQYLDSINTPPIDASGYYEDIYKFFNPNPVELEDDDTPYLDENHYPECDKHYFDDESDCICLELLLNHYLDLEIPDPLDFEVHDHMGPPAPAG